MKTITPKKSLGQHFLTDHNIARKIVGAMDTGLYGNILELGPGKGILTTYIAELPDTNLKLIEVDNIAVTYLKEKFPALQENILHEDFLKLDIKSLWEQKKFILIGNFPYNISSQIFFRVLEYRNYIPQLVCMIQKEVAERIASGPGSKTYGILSVLIQTFYSVERLFNVGTKVFDPPPRVQSSVIKLYRNKRKKLPCDEKLFFRVVKTGFNQRRKMLRNSLKNILLPLQEDHALLIKRPEQLGVEDFLDLCTWIEKRRSLKTKH